MTVDSVVVALKGLLANRMRSILTMLGILIGTAAVILLVAVGTGISNAVQTTIESMGSNALYVWPEQNPGGNDRGGTASRQAKLTDHDLKALSDKTRAPDVLAVSPVLQVRATAVADGTTYALQQFVGAKPIFAHIRNAVAESGRMVDEQDEADHAKVAVMGQTVIKKLWHKGYNPVGRDVQFNGIRFRIVGVLEKRGSNGFQDQDDVVFAPISTVEDTLVGKVESYHFLAVQAVSRQQTEAAQAETTQVLRETHHLRDQEAPDFLIFNQAQLLTAGKAAALLFSLLLGAVGDRTDPRDRDPQGARCPAHRHPQPVPHRSGAAVTAGRCHGGGHRHRDRPPAGRSPEVGGVVRVDRAVVRRVGGGRRLLRLLSRQPGGPAHPHRGAALRIALLDSPRSSSYVERPRISRVHYC